MACLSSHVVVDCDDVAAGEEQQRDCQCRRHQQSEVGQTSSNSWVELEAREWYLSRGETCHLCVSSSNCEPCPSSFERRTDDDESRRRRWRLRRFLKPERGEVDLRRPNLAQVTKVVDELHVKDV